MKKSFVAAALGAACLSLPACQTAPVAPPNGLLVGAVRHASPDPVIVVVKDRDTNRVVHRDFLAKSRMYWIPLEAGSYKVYAFADTDRDGVLGADELVSVTYNVSTPLVSGEVLELPSLTLSESLASAR